VRVDGEKKKRGADVSREVNREKSRNKDRSSREKEQPCVTGRDAVGTRGNGKEGRLKARRKKKQHQINEGDCHDALETKKQQAGTETKF